MQACVQLLVEQVKAKSIVADTLQLSQHVRDLLNTLHLLFQEFSFQIITQLRVLLLCRNTMQFQQISIDFPLHLQRRLHGVSGTLPFSGRLIDSLQLHQTASHILVFDQLFCMLTLLLTLLIEEFLKARQSDIIPTKVTSHGQVGVTSF